MDVPQYLDQAQFERLESIAVDLSEKGRDAHRDGDEASAKNKLAISHGMARYLESTELMSLNHDWLEMLCPTRAELRSLEKHGYEKILFIINIYERVTAALSKK